MTNPVGGSLGDASIEVHADTSGLSEEISRGTRVAAERAEDDGAFDGFVQAADRAGSRAGGKFGKSFARDAAGRLHEVETGRFVTEAEALGHTIGDKIGDGTKDSLGKKILSFGSLLAPKWIQTIALWVGLIGPAALQLAAVLAPAVGVVAAIIPAALGAAASIGVLKLAFNGVSQAFKDMSAGGAAFNKDLAKLSPSARSFVLEVKAALPQLKAFRSQIQESFFGPLSGVFTALAKTTLPQLSFYLNMIAESFGRIAAKLGLILTAPKSIRDLQIIFRNWSFALDEIEKGLAPLADALLTIGKRVPFINDGADAFTKFAFWFDKVITDADRTGKLTSFFQSTEQALHVIFVIGQSAFGIVSSLLSAAGKAGGGNAIVGVLGSINDALKGLNKSGALTEVFTVFNSFFAAIGKLLPLILPPLSALILALGKDFTDDLTRLMPTLISLVNNGFVPLLKATIGLLPVINPVVTAIIDLLNAVTAHPVIVETVFASIVAFMAATKTYAIVVTLQKMVSAFKDATVAAWGLDVALDANPIGVLIVAILAVIAGIALLVYYFKKLNDQTDFIGHIGTALKKAALATWGFIKSVGETIATFFTDTIPGYFDSFVQWLEGLPGRILAGIDNLANRILEGIGIAIGLGLVALLKGPELLWQEVVKINDRILNFFSTLVTSSVTEARKLIPQIAQAILEMGEKALTNAKNFSISFLKIILNAFLAPVQYAKTHFDQIVDLIEHLPSRIIGLGEKFAVAGLKLITKFFSGLAGGAGKVGDIADAIFGHLKNLINDAIGKINAGINKVGHIFGGISLPNIPKLARGAFITNPTVALLGERNPEVVLPTDNPARAAELLRQSGLADSLGVGKPNVYVTVKIGDRELTDIVDTQIASSNNETEMALANGPRT